MKVVVFGAAGWAGRPIVENLEGGHWVRACDQSAEAWEIGARIDGEYGGGAEPVYADISDFAAVDRAIEGTDAIVHAAVSFRGEEDDDTPFLVNLKGMYNVLEIARRRSIRRVVHVGSSPVVNPQGLFSDSEVRRGSDAGVYSVCKRAGGNVPAISRGLRSERGRATCMPHRRQPARHRQAGNRARAGGRLEHKLGLSPRSGAGLQACGREGGDRFGDPPHRRLGGGGGTLQRWPGARGAGA